MVRVGVSIPRGRHLGAQLGALLLELHHRAAVALVAARQLLELRVGGGVRALQLPLEPRLGRVRDRVRLRVRVRILGLGPGLG